MNKIFKVIYSKTKHCYVVVSELAKSHCKSTTKSHTTRNKTALTAAVLLALGTFTFTAVPTVQATDSLFSNDYVGTNYKKDDGKSYSESETKNYHGAGAQGVGSNTLGMNALAGKNTITVGDRDASVATESVYIGAKYDANNQVHPSSGEAVVSVGYGSDAAGTGSIAIGSGAAADSFDNAGHGTNPDKKSQSIAIGYNAQAKQNNIAIGAGSVVTDAASKEAAYLTGKNATSYVSVGSNDVQRRISNVADGAADSDVATIKQLRQAVEETDASKKANIDASNIGENLKFKEDGKTAAESTDKTANEDAWGKAIGTGKVAQGNGQLVTGGTVYTALDNQKKDLSVSAGWGINIDKDQSTGSNQISLNRNLGKEGSLHYKDKWDVYDATVTVDDTCLILGGEFNVERLTHYRLANSDWGAKGTSSVIAGGSDNLANGRADAVFGGELNVATGSPTKSNPFIGWNTVSGGSQNLANGEAAAVFGGVENKSTGDNATVSGGAANLTSGDSVAAAVFGGVGNISSNNWSVVSGGGYNRAMTPKSTVIGGWGNATIDLIPSVTSGDGERGYSATVIGGIGNYASGMNSLALGGGGYQYGSDSDGNHYVHDGYYVRGYTSVGIDGGSTGNKAAHSLAAGNQSVVTVANGTAIGYQSTADEEGTIAFGHDRGDISGYTVIWKQKATSANGKYYDANGTEITKDKYDALKNPDNTYNDYSKDPTITEDKHQTAAYNRLVKVADGVDDHDVVVMEQLNNAKNDLKVNAGWGISVADVTTPNNDGTETTTKNVISLNRNLGTNYGNIEKGKGKVTFEAQGENALILGGAASTLFGNADDNVKAGAYGKDSVLVGGFNNLIEANDNDPYKIQTGEDAVIVGGDTNTVTGLRSVIVGGYQNNVSGDHSIVIGGASNETDGAGAGVFGGQSNKAAGEYSSVLGGDHNEADGHWSSAIGGTTNTASGLYATTLGGINNDAKGNESVVVGGVQNVAIGEDSTVNGGAENTSYGMSSYAAGGMHNMAFGNASVALGGIKSNVNAKVSTGIAGGSTEEKAITALAAGHQSVVTNSGVEWRKVTQEDVDAIKQDLPWSGFTYTEPDEPYTTYVLDKVSTAVGYQSTADAPGVIAFGHDKGDVASVAKKWKQKATMEVGDDYSVTYYDANHKEISADDYYKLANADGTLNDYTQDPIGTEDKTYQSAYYNRLVKAADGIDAHDAVVMEQLKPYTKSDASNIGANLKTYTVGDDGETITEAEASDADKTKNENAWGKALGTGKITNLTQSDTNNPATNGSQQLVTGGTVFNETRISAKDNNGQSKIYNYLNVNNSAGKNLEALDSALHAVNTTAGAHTALTVDGIPAGTGKDEKTNQDVYAGKNILLHESTDTNGKVTYDLKLAKDINIGKPGKDGQDGKIGIDGKDGHIGLNGSDGITVRGLDGKDGTPGKDGVTITGPQGEAGKDGIDGKVGISGKDGKDAVSISGKDGVGHIGLTGPAGTNGRDGTNAVDITVKNGYDGENGVNGKNGVDGTSLTRIVYTDKTGEHQVATMEDGMKFKGDDTTVINKKLNNTMEFIGGAKGDLTEGNIGVNSTDKGQLKVQLAKDLKGITSISNQTTTKDGDKDVTTGAKITLGADGTTTISGGDVNVSGNKITNVGSGIEKDANGKYTVTDQNKGNAANIGDVQNMVNDAKTELISGDNGLNNKANIDASNIGANLKGEDGKTTASDAEKTANENAWGKAIGTGKIEANNGQLVTGDTVYNEVRPKEDGNYVKTNQTTGANLSALDSKIGKLDETKKYNYIDSKESTSISDNLTNLDTQVKKNADDITNINNSISSLDQNAVKYDDSSKSKISLGGEGGTTITNVKDGALNDNSTDAVNGRQLNAVQKQVTNNTNEITKIKNGEGFTDAGKTVIKKLSQDAVQIKAGDRIKVDETTDENTGNKTYTISANNNGKVAKDDGNLISGDTLYKEVHVDSDGSYIKSNNTVGQNLSALDSGLKTTSDLIHTNAKGDTIQIGGNSTATKIDVSGKDKDGNTTGRVITGVVTDVKDLTSAANVGYVNGITSANTQQIYRDMNNAYSRLDTNINRAAAGSNALAALHPLDFDPADKASFAVGYGHYHNANAAAVGAFYQPNANTMVNMGISLGNGDPGFNAGVSFKLGKGSAYNGVSKAEMAQTIHDQAEEISAIKANDAAKDKRIDALEKENQEMKKQIQEILSRLNG